MSIKTNKNIHSRNLHATDEKEESSSDETGHLGGSAVFGSTASIYSTMNRYRFFADSKHAPANKRFFTPVLKPDLTEEEKELLKHFLKSLDLSLDEFKLKLSDLKLSLKTFTLMLKEFFTQLKIPSPKFSLAFIDELTKRGLLAETFLEKHNAKKHTPTEEMQAPEYQSPSPLSMRPKRPR
jgi:hypothetical protein